MEVKCVIERYRDAVLPISRREVAAFLDVADGKREELTATEREWLDDYISEFRYDRTGSTKGFAYLFGQADSTESAGLGDEFSNSEKFLYAYTDSNVSLFVNGLLDADVRGSTATRWGRTTPSICNSAVEPAVRSGASLDTTSNGPMRSSGGAGPYCSAILPSARATN